LLVEVLENVFEMSTCATGGSDTKQPCCALWETWEVQRGRASVQACTCHTREG